MGASTHFFAEFFGRADELALLASLHERTVREFRGSSVVIGGEAGIGKSRLIDEFVERSAGRRALARIGGEGTAPGPYGTIGRLLDALAALAKSANATAKARERLDAVLAAGATLDAESEGRLAAETAQAFALTAARRGGIVAVVEDAQASDVASLRLLAPVVKRLARAPIFFVLSIASDGPLGDGGRADALASLERAAEHRIVLEPLAPLLVAAAVHRAARTLSREAVDDIVERAEGNPFFAAELARAAAGSRDGGIPPSVSSATMARIAHLPPAAREVLARAAIAGREFDADTVSEIYSGGASEVNEALRAARESGFVRELPNGHFSFRHALYRESLESTLAPGEAAALHRALAERLERQGEARDVFAVAAHRRAAGDGVLAIEASERAADRAAALGAHADAAEHYREALALCAPDSDDYLRIAAKACESFASVGPFESAVKLARDVLRRLEAAGRDADAQALALAMAARARVSGDRDGARTFIDRALSIATASNDPGAFADATIAVAQLDIYDGAYASAAARLEALGPPPGPPALRGYRYLNQRGLARQGTGDLADATADFRAARDLAIVLRYDRGELAALANFTSMELEAGRASSVATLLREGLSKAQRSDFGYILAGLTLINLRCDIALGRFDAAVLDAHAALDLDTSFAHWKAELEATAFFIASVAGDDRLAARCPIERALETARGTGITSCISNVTAAAARSFLRTEPKVAAAKIETLWIDGAFAEIDEMLAESVAVVGTPKQIAHVRERLRPNRIDYFEAIVARREGHRIEASRRANAALAMVGETSLERAHCLEILGRNDEAQAAYERAGAHAELARFRRAPRPAADRRLSEREEQVCRLIVTGLSLREAAARLGIGVRTAETHLAGAYRKLDVSTRAELIESLPPGDAR